MNGSRTQKLQRRLLRIGLLAVLFMVAGLGYWQYLQHLTHGGVSVVPHAAVAMPTVMVPKPAPATEPSAQLPPVLKQAANAGIAAVAAYVVESVKASTAVPATQVVPANPPTEVATARNPTVAVPVSSATPKPAQRFTPRTRTPEERLAQAGQIALRDMLDKASKYPDAYGFGPSDLFEKARLGNPIPIYTIAESNRASYKAGQPVKPLLTPADQWVFPVLSGSRVCCMVSVKFTGRDYVPGSSSKSLGMAWHKILEKWPETGGFHPQLIVHSRIPGYYFTIPELPVPNLTDSVQMFYFNPEVSPADVILTSWR